MLLNEPFGGVIPGARGAALATLLRTGEPLTGRRVHELARGNHSLGAIQQGLDSWVRLGVIHSRLIGRAKLYSIVETHGAVSALRALVDPWRILRSAVEQHIDSSVAAVIVFGSTSRDTATPDSDIDLAIIASSDWTGQYDLQDSVSAATGNPCDVLLFTPGEFHNAATKGEPVVAEIMRDGITLFGEKPQLLGKVTR